MKRKQRSEQLEINPEISIPLSEISFTYARSGGPGGQNVNKVNSKAILRWSVRDSLALPESIKDRFVSRYRRQITEEGCLVIAGQRFRSAPRNAEDCLARLAEMILAVAVEPKKRKASQPTKGSIARRLDEKKQRSERKSRRRTQHWDE
jgi:ribosome-associated protein